VAGDESNYSYALSLQELKGRAKKQKIRIRRSIRTIDMVRVFKKCIGKAIKFDGWEGEQGTTVGDNEPDDWSDYELEDWPEEWMKIRHDESHPKYGIFWRCVRWNISRIREEESRGGDYTPRQLLRRPPPPTPPISPPAPPMMTAKKYGYSWLLLLTDDLVDQGLDKKRLRQLVLKLIRRHQDDLVLVVLAGTLPSFTELKLISPVQHLPTSWFKEFVEDINARDPRIVFELQIHDGSDKNGNTVSPINREVYLYGLPDEEE